MKKLFNSFTDATRFAKECLNKNITVSIKRQNNEYQVEFKDSDSTNLNNSQITVKYVGSNESTQSIFHRSTCGWMKNVPLNSIIHFSNREDAIKTGFKPCKSCRP